MLKIIFILILFTFPQHITALVKYKLMCNSKLLDSSRVIAYQQLGISNRDSAIIKKYLKSVGLKFPNPYCAAGQYYCFWMASNRMNYSLDSIPLEPTGLAQNMFHKSKTKGLITKYLAENDDLIFWRYPKSWKGHVERVLETKTAGWVLTIGFNTKKGNFEGVNILKRNIYHPLQRMQVLGIIGFERN